MDADSIAHLLSTQRYSEQTIPNLEQYVQTQAQTGSYDLEANLSLLKLYNFYPEKRDIQVSDDNDAVV